jgi:hypothetical protein
MMKKWLVTYEVICDGGVNDLFEHLKQNPPPPNKIVAIALAPLTGGGGTASEIAEGIRRARDGRY